ncbi:hypothetical protein D3C80_1575250 [compost metagenome]
MNTSGDSRICTLVTSAGQLISASGFGSTSFKVKPGQSARVTARNPLTLWLVTGTATLAESSDFSALLAVNGYQKLPSGKIEQWGLGNSGATTAGAPVVTPIAFPNAFLHAYAVDSGLVCAAYGTTVVNNSTFTLYGMNNAGISSNYQAHFLAIGY